MSYATVSARIAELRSHGVRVEYAIAADVYSARNERVAVRDISAYAEVPGDMPFVVIDDTADSADNYQGTHIDVANFLALEKEFGSAMIRVGYNGVDKLGFFVHSVPDSLIEIACNLHDGSMTVYDESVLSEVEDEAITESWEWLSSDVYRTLPSELQDLYFDLGEDSVRDGFWTLLSNSDYYPECTGGEVVWDDDMAEKLITTAIRNIRRAELGRPALTV